MSPHKYFAQIVDKGKRGVVQEVDPRMFTFITKLPKIDAAVNEPNLLQFERYPDLGLFHPTNEITTYYAGVNKVDKHDLVVTYHYFVALMPTKLKPNKKKAVLVTDYAVTLQR